MQIKCQFQRFSCVNRELSGITLSHSNLRHKFFNDSCEDLNYSDYPPFILNLYILCVYLSISTNHKYDVKYLHSNY